MMSNNIVLNDLRNPVLVDIDANDKDELSLSGNRQSSRTSNGNLATGDGLAPSMNNNEAKKLLDVTESESESDLNLQFTLPKRKVRFKRKFRPKGKKQVGDGASTENTSCLCHCTESLAILAFLAVSVCLAVLMWFHYNLSSKVDHMQKQTNAIEAQCKETPEALHDYHIQLKFLDSNVSLFGDELKKINSEIVTLKKDVEKLKQSSAEIKASIAAAPAIKTLPKDVESLSESVASIGSKIAALESVVKDLKEQQSTLSSNADSITKQQETMKENIQEILNASHPYSEMPSTMTTPSPIGVERQVTDSIAQINSSLSSKMEQLNMHVDALHKSLVDVQERNNHTHEVMHSLQKYVHENITQSIASLEELRVTPTVGFDSNFHMKTMEEIINKELSQALNCSNVSGLTLANQSWMSLLNSTNQMIGIYLQLYAQLSPDSKLSVVSNPSGTEIALQLLNRTLSGLYHQHDGDVRILREELNNCESAVGQVGQNMTLLSQRVDGAIGGIRKEMVFLKSEKNTRQKAINDSEPSTENPELQKQTFRPDARSLVLFRRRPVP